MKDLDKELKKFSPKERAEIKRLTKRILGRNFVGLNCKKLKGLKNLFRVRRGSIRILFELNDNKEPTVFAIERRREDTYKF